eukprot:1689761-Amphidinium_carterae.1
MSKFGGTCRLCGGEGSMQHILWECEGRRLSTACKDEFELLQAQVYMTTTFIERSEDERAPA